MPRRISRWIPFVLLATPSLRAAPDSAGLEARFSESVRPFLASYCVSCHSGKNPAAHFDLRQYTSVASIVQDYPRWALVLDKLSSSEMPPKAAPQPPAAERRGVIDWIDAMRKEEARKHAGDPGPVLARRLSNAEYNYTIRDLTGADLRPAREFPVDPANPSGFDNSGESLAMSPALLNKYLQAARAVADHLVLKPSGFDFAPHPMLAETMRITSRRLGGSNIEPPWASRTPRWPNLPKRPSSARSTCRWCGIFWSSRWRR
jgi:hypothetical protein